MSIQPTGIATSTTALPTINETAPDLLVAEQRLADTLARISKTNALIRKDMANNARELAERTASLERNLRAYTTQLRAELEEPNLCIRVCLATRRFFEAAFDCCRSTWNYFFA